MLIKFKKNIIKNKKYIIYALFFSLFIIPFIFIFISLKKSWYDGMSVGALIYICLGFFIITYRNQKHRWKKIKNILIF